MNNTEHTEPSWLTGLRNKRPFSWLRALTYLLEAGLRNGQVTANDIPEDCYFPEPKIIGACFKDLRKFGFRKTGSYIKTTATRKKGRDVAIWELVEPLKAKRAVDILRRNIIEVGKPMQLEMI